MGASTGAASTNGSPGATSPGGSSAFGNAAGFGANAATGVGPGGVTNSQPNSMSSVGNPTGPSTTPGGPPSAGTSNMTGTGQ